MTITDYHLACYPTLLQGSQISSVHIAGWPLGFRSLVADVLLLHEAKHYAKNEDGLTINIGFRLTLDSIIFYQLQWVPELPNW